MLQKNQIGAVALCGQDLRCDSIGNREASDPERQFRLSILRRQPEAMPQGTPGAQGNVSANARPGVSPAHALAA
jgi:hypothetical protein